MFLKFKKSSWATWVFVLIFIVITFVNGWTKIDPDFGWHLTMGKLITYSGIPKTDPFSYTMTSFPFVDHEWLTNIIIYKLNETIGYSGLAILFALLFLASLIVVGQRIKPENLNSLGLSNPRNSLLILAAAVMIPYSGIRPQVQTWLWLSILLWLAKGFETGAKLKYFLPFLFLLWTNLHGGFAIGIATLLTFIVFRTIRLKKIIIGDFLIFLLCLLATLINPYGFRLWGEIWMQLSDGSLRWRIAEWTPSLFNLDLSYMFFLVLACFSVIKYRKKFFLEEVVIFIGFLVEAILSLRHVPLWVIVSTPMVVKACDFLFQEISNIKYGVERLRKVMIFLFLLSGGLFIVQIIFTLRSPIDEGNYYPKGAVSYLKNNIPNGEIFSSYGWGGYLIWNLPEKKVFIDGRMPSWRWEGVRGESKNAMEDYIKVVTDKTAYLNIFNQYGVDTVLWYKTNKKPNPFGFLEKKIRKVFKQKEEKEIVDRLVADKWEIKYDDSLSVVLQK